MRFVCNHFEALFEIDQKHPDESETIRMADDAIIFAVESGVEYKAGTFAFLSHLNLPKRYE